MPGWNRFADFKTSSSINLFRFANGVSRPIVGTNSCLMSMGMVDGEGEDKQKKENERREFKLRVGKAVDTLRYEWPLFFQQGLSDYSIYDNNIRFSEPQHHKFYIQSKVFYKMFLSCTRHVLKWYLTDLSFNIRSIQQPSEHQLTIRFVMEGSSRISVLKSYVRNDHFIEKSVYEGNFIYRFGSNGLIIEHQITDLQPIPRKFAPLNAIAWWQRSKGPVPEIADAMNKSSQE